MFFFGPFDGVCCWRKSRPERAESNKVTLPIHVNKYSIHILTYKVLNPHGLHTNTAADATYLRQSRKKNWKKWAQHRHYVSYTFLLLLVMMMVFRLFFVVWVAHEIQRTQARRFWKASGSKANRPSTAKRSSEKSFVVGSNQNAWRALLAYISLETMVRNKGLGKT